MHPQHVSIAFPAVTFLVGLIVLAVVLAVIIASLTGSRRQKNGQRNPAGQLAAFLIGGVMVLGLGLLFRWVQFQWMAVPQYAGSPSHVIEHVGIPFLGYFIMLAVVVVLFGLAAMIRRGGGAVVGLLLLLFIVLGGFFFNMKYTAHRSVSATAAAEYADMLHDAPFTSRSKWENEGQANTASSGSGISSAISIEHDVAAEVDDWDGVEQWDGADNAAADSSNSGEVVSKTKVKRKPVLPKRPDWVDETEPSWDEDRRVWSKTVQIGPFETGRECLERYDPAIQATVREYARWHANRISDADPILAVYQPDQLPLADAAIDRPTENYTGVTNTANRSIEHYVFKRGDVTEIFQTTIDVNLEEDAKPWHVMFARVEFDRGFQRRVDRHVRHGLSLDRATRLAGIWGIAILGMAVALGGLRLFGGKDESDLQLANMQTTASEPIAAEPIDANVPSNKPTNTMSAAAHRPWIHRGNVKFVLAPVICTVIYWLMADDFHDMVFEDGFEDFWPKWVWFGCAIAFAFTTIIPRLSPSNDSIKKGSRR